MIQLSPFSFSNDAAAGRLMPEEAEFLAIDAAATHSSPDNSSDVDARLDELSACETFVLHGEGRRMIGTLAIYERSDRVMWLDSLAIRASQRSRGVGGAALGWVESIAKERNCVAVMGRAWAEPKTIGFYTRNNYDFLGDSGRSKYLLVRKPISADSSSLSAGS